MEDLSEGKQTDGEFPAGDGTEKKLKQEQNRNRKRKVNVNNGVGEKKVI
jgi:hypothetical protein